MLNRRAFLQALGCGPGMLGAISVKPACGEGQSGEGSGTPQYNTRLRQFYFDINAIEPKGFDAVTVPLYCSGDLIADYTFVRLRGTWHLFHILGKPDYLKQKDYWERSIGHAVSEDFIHWETREPVLPRGTRRWCKTQVFAPSAICHDDTICMLLCGSSESGRRSIGLATSQDGYEWCLTEEPVLAPSPTHGIVAIKDPHLLQVGDRFVVYFTARRPNGEGIVGVADSTDLTHWEYRGFVWDMPGLNPGTTECESSCALERNGLYHLFFTSGFGVWHAVGSDPYHFDYATGIQFMGNFHAQEIVRIQDRWFLTSTAKEHLRKLARMEGIASTRDFVKDEMRLAKGLFLTELHWLGDAPFAIHPQLA